jgi:hypothetical protein
MRYKQVSKFGVFGIFDLVTIWFKHPKTCIVDQRWAYEVNGGKKFYI